MIRNAISVGALVLLLLTSTVLVGRQSEIQWSAFDEGRQRITLHVADSGGLVPRSRVLLRGVPIGRVTQITADAHGVAIEFQFPPTVGVSVDSEFRIENLSALGETYLAIKPAHEGGRLLVDGQHIEAEPGTVAGTIGEAAVALSRFLGALNPDLLNKIIDELNTALADSAQAPVLAEATQSLSTLIGYRKDDIRDVLALTQVLLGESDVIAPSMAGFREAAPNFFNNLQEAVEGAIKLFYQTGRYPDDIVNGANPLLARTLQFLKDAGPDLYNLTSPLVPPLQATAAALTTVDTSRLLDSAIDSLEVPGALTVHVIPSR